MSTLHVHMLYKPEQPYYDYFIKNLDKTIHISFGLEPEVTNYSILISGRPPEKLLAKSKNLCSLIIPFSGIPHETSVILKKFSQIKLHNIHHNATITAEMAIALMMSTAKKIVTIDKQFRTHNWQGRMTPSPLLSQKNVLILGYGAIGKRVARICSALEMKVTAVRRTKGYNDNGIVVHNIGDIDELIPRSQVVIICLPQTPKTTNLLDSVRLNALPSQAIIVNIGRAVVINEKALYTALCERRLFAGLDVWYNYPKKNQMKDFLPANFPFHELNNVVMSPHRAGRCDEVEFLRMDHLIHLLNTKASGKKMPNEIDINRGY
ncbi:NAD(P)-dependent oxidoreductase [Candidatus Uabimicrobium sp. HlEnr_7]|uniref:NAD(P)-dependent oxidoreductase n=1 Tax=Candidatus Uabimicrobium helgolandensis TaxID=3095367 RepID=UPI0035588860